MTNTAALDADAVAERPIIAQLSVSHVLYLPALDLDAIRPDLNEDSSTCFRSSA